MDDFYATFCCLCSVTTPVHYELFDFSSFTDTITAYEFGTTRGRVNKDFLNF